VLFFFFFFFFFLIRRSQLGSKIAAKQKIPRETPPDNHAQEKSNRKQA
jgi:hypothetical protein